MSFLADTNIVSELAKQRPDRGVVAWASSVDRIAISVITVDEIRFGLAWRANRRVEAWFEAFFNMDVEVLDVTRVIAERSGALRGALARQGDVRSQWDSVIAATAVVHRLTVVTRNVAHFKGCGHPVLNPFGG